MKYLVDANILSELTKPAPDPRVVQWLRAKEADIAVDSPGGNIIGEDLVERLFTTALGAFGVDESCVLLSVLREPLVSFV